MTDLLGLYGCWVIARAIIDAGRLLAKLREGPREL